MTLPKYLYQTASAALACLIVLSTPDGQAAVRTDPGYSLAISNDTGLSNTATINTASTSPRTHAMALMGESPLPPVPENTTQKFIQMDAGGSATCGILQGSRRLLCWGRKDLGQASPPIGRYKFVAMGENHGCALTTEGHLRCWGVPAAFSGANQAKGRFLAIAAGDDHTCAIRTNGTAVCWGNNDNGELNVPDKKFRQIVARGDHSCGITRSKRLLCWGEKAFTDYSQSIHVRVKKIATGQLHACALGLDGLAKCWGNGIHGENQAPADRFIDIVAGDWHTCGLRADHTALCWGRDQYGQTHVGMEKYRLIAGGGMQTCGILHRNLHLACRGSFANNEVMYPFDANASSQAYQQDGVVRPQLAFLTIFQGISGVLNLSIVNGGKMLDGKMGKWETVGWTTQVVSLFTNMFINWFGPKPEDPTVKIFDILKDIQADIRKIEKGIDELKLQLDSLKLTTLQLWCDQQLNDYGSAYNLLEGVAYGSTSGARSAYMQLLKAQETALTRSIDQQIIVAYPTAELEKFRNQYLGQIKSARNKLTNALIGNGVQTAAFTACFQKGYAEWKTQVSSDSKAYPFDDRPIYNHVYKVLSGAMAMQAELLGMEQDMEMQQAYQKLVEPRADNVPVVDFNPQEHALGFCLYADERKVSSHPEYSPRWEEVANICQQNRDRTQNAYVDLVKQVEFVGGAYTDDQVVLSLTSEQMGSAKGNDRNWLWMRNIPDEFWALSGNDGHGSVTGKWMDFQQREDSSPFYWMPPFALDSDAGIYYRNRGCWNSVCKDESFGEAVWHSNAQAWEDVFGFRNNRRHQFNVSRHEEDFLGAMDSLEDMLTEECERDANGNCKLREISSGNYEIIKGPRLRLFGGISGKPFWLTGKSFLYDARARVDIPEDYVNDKTHQHMTLKCFMAEGVNGINPDYFPWRPGFYRNNESYSSSDWEKWVWGSDFDALEFSGRVCSTNEMAATMARQEKASDVPDVKIKDCIGGDYFGKGPSVGAKTYANFCAGTGYGAANKYRDALGWMVTKARLITAPFGSDYFVVDKYDQKYKPVVDGHLYHMPVVDISQRKCKPKMVGSGTRPAFRNAGDVNIPSICGEDMDKLIKAIVPRPEFPPVPEKVVRLPEVD